jgi:hypothetical protein
MLSAAILVQPLEIFDLLMHGSPFELLKLMRMRGIFQVTFDQ